MNKNRWCDLSSIAVLFLSACLEQFWSNPTDAKYVCRSLDMEPSVSLIEVQEGPKPNKAKPDQACLPPSIKTFDWEGWASSLCDFASSLEGQLMMHMSTWHACISEASNLIQCFQPNAQITASCATFLFESYWTTEERKYGARPTSRERNFRQRSNVTKPCTLKDRQLIQNANAQEGLKPKDPPLNLINDV